MAKPTGAAFTKPRAGAMITSHRPMGWSPCPVTTLPLTIMALKMISLVPSWLTTTDWGTNQVKMAVIIRKIKTME